jgi:hypothetical protein
MVRSTVEAGMAIIARRITHARQEVETETFLVGEEVCVRGCFGPRKPDDLCVDPRDGRIHSAPDQPRRGPDAVWRDGIGGDKWHLDEVVIKIAAKTHWLWRAVDQHSVVLDVLVQSHRHARAAKRLLRKLLKRQGRAPRVMITDKLASYPAAKKDLMPGVEHRRIRGSTKGPRTRTSRPDDASGR